MADKNHEALSKDSKSEEDASEGESSVITLHGPNCTFKLQGEIATTLLNHQRDGLKWLWSLHCQGKGGILGDDMGLGKTRQICSFLAGLFNSRLIERALVVAPKTLLPHWVKELSVVGLSEKTIVYHGTCKKAREEALYSIRQGHHIKNPDTQRAKSLLEIPCAHRLVVSGTPWQNNLKEMWALFNFCCPGLLGDENWFYDKFGWHIRYGRDKIATKKNKRLGSSVAKELRDLIQPYFLRRTKSEVGANISTKQEIVVWLRLTNIQQHLYKKFLRSLNLKTRGNSGQKKKLRDGAQFAALEIMRKICDHPLLLSKRDLSEGKYKKLLQLAEAKLVDELVMHRKDVGNAYKFKVEHEFSCKLSFIMSLLGNLIPQGHCVLIFSRNLKMLDLIQVSLSSSGYEFLRIDGTTKAKDRTKIVNDFQQHAVAPIFLLSSKVGGLGLTLTRADHVIVTGPDWNPSTDDQIVDRACRIGQRKDVVAYRLITCGTFEEKAYRKQVFKDGLCKTGTQHKEQTRYFSTMDLRYLFDLPREGFDVSITQQRLENKHDWELTMDESFKEHIEFLKSLDIAGVSHHNNILLCKEESDDEDESENDEASRVESAFYSKRAKWRNMRSSPNSIHKLSELFTWKANHDMGTSYLESKSRFRKSDWTNRFAQESNEWNHSYQRQKTLQDKLAERRNNQVENIKLKYQSQLVEEVKGNGVVISSPTSNQIKHTQCQPQKSNESIISHLIHRAKRLFKMMR